MRSLATLSPALRTRGAAPVRPVLAVVEDGPAGPAVARAAAALAGPAGAEILLVVPVKASSGLTTDPAVARSRHRRLAAAVAATAARVTPRLAAGLSWTVQRIDVRPGERGRHRALDAVLRLAARRRAAAIVTPAGPTGSGLDAAALDRRRYRRGGSPVPVVPVATDLAAPRPAPTGDGC